MSSYTGFLFKSGGFSSATACLLRQAQDPDFGSQHWMKEEGIKKKKKTKREGPVLVVRGSWLRRHKFKRTQHLHGGHSHHQTAMQVYIVHFTAKTCSFQEATELSR